MIDTADLAVLETQTDVMNDVERELLAEVRRLTDDAQNVAALEGKILELEGERDDARSDLDDARNEIRRLEAEQAAVGVGVEHEGHLSGINLDHVDGPAFTVRCHVASEADARRLAPLMLQGPVCRVVMP